MEKTASAFEEDVLKGLKKNEKSLPSKYFYDERGSELFEKISNLDEYYLTDAELEILQHHSEEISKVIGPKSLIIEFGSGSSKKTRLLLEELKDLAGYVPVDISREFLFEEAEKLQEEFPELDITPIAADYTTSFELNVNGHADRRVIFFPGSTIGNFTPDRARDFLFQSADLLKNNGGLLIGVDLKKAPEVLNKAYNDREGVTAEFNKNLLKRINRELDADFIIEQFRHRAFYNEEEGRVEMYLVSLENQSVSIAGEKIDFKKGEMIHTENSYKYTVEEFEELISERYLLKKTWFDSDELFSLHYFEKR
ncbi:MAG: L-histidine N(alpha)-methyltransferase [Balneolaceae bacterium]|nr:L-histidine N(alpha)-methyltransferase [Balneolaceae bacterium]